jgi:hypothetical protein
MIFREQPGVTQTDTDHTELSMDAAYELLLEKLIENEMAMSGLYDQFGETFAKDAVFWIHISKQEQDHARWLEQLRELARKDKIERGKLISVIAIEASIRFINSIQDKCKKGEISRVNAFVTAFDIENSLIEKKFFQVFGLDRNPLKKVFNALEEETKKHKKMILDALHDIKPIKKEH